MTEHQPTTPTTAEPMVERGPALSLDTAVRSLLPTTGSVEVQFDTPGRVHEPHTHETSETLLVVEGDIVFRWHDTERRAEPGERLLLPQGVMHSSVAGEAGCLYVIATEWRSQEAAA